MIFDRRGVVAECPLVTHRNNSIRHLDSTDTWGIGAYLPCPVFFFNTSFFPECYTDISSQCDATPHLCIQKPRWLVYWKWSLKLQASIRVCRAAARQPTTLSSADNISLDSSCSSNAQTKQTQKLICVTALHTGRKTEGLSGWGSWESDTKGWNPPSCLCLYAFHVF